MSKSSSSPATGALSLCPPLPPLGEVPLCNYITLVGSKEKISRSCFLYCGHSTLNDDPVGTELSISTRFIPVNRPENSYRGLPFHHFISLFVTDTRFQTVQSCTKKVDVLMPGIAQGGRNRYLCVLSPTLKLDQLERICPIRWPPPVIYIDEFSMEWYRIYFISASSVSLVARPLYQDPLYMARCNVKGNSQAWMMLGGLEC